MRSNAVGKRDLNPWSAMNIWLGWVGSGQVWELAVILMWTYPELHCQRDWTTALQPLQEGRRSLLLQELQRQIQIRLLDHTTLFTTN